MDEHLKLALQIFGFVFVFAILAVFGSVTLYVLVASLMGW